MTYENHVLRILAIAHEYGNKRAGVTKAEQVPEISRIFGDDWHDLYVSLFTPDSSENQHNQLLIEYEKTPLSLLHIIQSMAKLQINTNAERLALAKDLITTHGFKDKISEALRNNTNLNHLMNDNIDSTYQLFENQLIHNISQAISSKSEYNIYINPKSKQLLYGTSDAKLTATVKVVIDLWYRTLVFGGTNPITFHLTQECINRFNNPFPKEDQDPTQSPDAMDAALTMVEDKSAHERMILFNYAVARLEYIEDHVEMVSRLLSEMTLDTQQQVSLLILNIDSLREQIDRLYQSIDDDMKLSKIDTAIARMNNLAITAKKLIDMNQDLLLNKPNQQLNEKISLELNSCLANDRELRGSNALTRKSQIDHMLFDLIKRLENPGTENPTRFHRIMSGFRPRSTNSNNSTTSNSSSASDSSKKSSNKPDIT